ncbi:hypothetical protein JRQ81_005270 [Phrynocephalus forsythii]|uniref:Uncharacterized protein n=1 Tax=Phrynocephalus forsythii TaxID=171643 RepID=A0A9Q0Y4W4_9SAUR|nr:hypothetical protein JRQ81_005270 [Phrynocephalus forsythii]
MQGRFSTNGNLPEWSLNLLQMASSNLGWEAKNLVRFGIFAWDWKYDLEKAAGISCTFEIFPLFIKGT